MFRQENIQCKFEAEEMAAKQNYESEKQLAWDNVKVSQCAGDKPTAFHEPKFETFLRKPPHPPTGRSCLARHTQIFAS